MKILEAVKQNEKQLIEDLQGLLRIDSTLVENLDNPKAPFGEGIKKSLDYVLDLGSKFGFKVKNIDNLAGHIEFGEGEDIIGILCHIDVVPAVGKWTYHPYSATINDGKIYARGAIDDKGPTISSLYALKVIKDLGLKLNKRVRLIIGTDEETKWRCMDAYFKSEEMPTLGFSPDANFPVIYGEKGIMSIDLISYKSNDLEFKSGVRYNVVPDEAIANVNVDLNEAFNKYLSDNNFEGDTSSGLKLYGTSAHAMQPEKGVNAAINLCKFLSEHIDNNVVKFVSEKLDDTRFKTMNLDFSDPEMKDLTVNVAIVEIDKSSGKIGLNLRYPTNWDKEGFLRELKKQASFYALDIKVVSDQTPHYVSPDDDLVKTLHNAYIHYTNDTTTKCITIGGGTYARALKKGVAFGSMFPGREDVVHQVDEHIFIEDLIKATSIYVKAIHDLGK
ncbi:MAG: dipeptidase PepV [Bacilli bacterium]|nr:dipeptidase PepV [Bacilli bacterium]